MDTGVRYVSDCCRAAPKLESFSHEHIDGRCSCCNELISFSVEYNSDDSVRYLLSVALQGFEEFCSRYRQFTSKYYFTAGGPDEQFTVKITFHYVDAYMHDDDADCVNAWVVDVLLSGIPKNICRDTVERVKGTLIYFGRLYYKSFQLEDLGSTLGPAKSFAVIGSDPP